MNTRPPLRALLCGLLLAVRLHAASDVTISTGATSGGSFSGGSPNVFTPSAATAVASAGTIASSLNLGTPVTVNTASAFGSPGDLTVANPVTKAAGTGGATLTLNGVLTATLTARQRFALGNSLSAGTGHLLVQTGTVQSAATQTVTANTAGVAAGTLESSSDPDTSFCNP